MIISASRRTDIPAFYGQWMLNRINAGMCYVRMQNGALQPVDLKKAEAYVYWTRMFNMLDMVADLPPFYVTYTITGYGHDLDTRGPALSKQIDNFQRLATKTSPQLVEWRYDPIIINEQHGMSWHMKNFDMLAEQLSGYTDTCVVSVVDAYGKATARMSGKTHFAPEGTRWQQLVAHMIETGAKYNIRLQSCSEDLTAVGIPHGKCIDNERLALLGVHTAATKDPGQRKLCGCIQSVDIGAYDRCPFGCVYCYATNEFGQIAAKVRAHRADALFL